MADESSPTEAPEDLAAQMAATLAVEEEARRLASEQEAARVAAEAEAERQAAEEIRAAIASRQVEEDAAREKDEAAEQARFAAEMAALADVSAAAKPEPLSAADEIDAPLNAAGVPQFGPTFPDELAEAGLIGLPFSYESAKGVLLFAPEITAADRQRVVEVVEAHDPEAGRMGKARANAFATAMAFGNRITDQVEKRWSNIERASFTAQEIEAKAIVAGEPMAPDAMLPILAQHKGITAVAYAQQVLDNAATYRQLAIAAVILRRGADGLLDVSLDTPEKLDAAMLALRTQAAQFCAQFGLSLT